MQKKLLVALIAFVGLASTIFGQNAGTITGRVVDPSGSSGGGRRSQSY